VDTEPQQLEQDIAHTRERLGRDVDALTEKVSPTAAAKRGVGRVRDAAASARESVMGKAPDVASAKDSVVSAAGNAKESVAGAAETATVKVRQQARGNPLAAGVIAFGLGWLVSSLVPASKAEEQLGGQLKEKSGAVREQLSSAASQVVDDLREPARDAVEQVKQTAADSAGTVKDEASSQASGVAGEAKDRGQSVAETAQGDDPARAHDGVLPQPPPL
jgi:hypothetical protein